ncbi:MAG: sugar ABC transporter ATP-binding protein [Treponema sp.]|jgi:ribose transport system ATP-binding protein|nr:sugar ABC transporter ATP-binding protein [Treponema sp.]
MDTQFVLKMEHISKTFPGTRALNDVSIDLRPGEILALVGENGAGKSTMMNVLGGAFLPDEGAKSAIIIDGKEMGAYDAAAARDAGIGFVHQELSSCLQLTVAENVFMGRLKKYKTGMGFTDYNRINRETAKYLEIFDSKIKPSQKMRELKIADQQVVEIIKSISINCKILIFDEPTSSLTDTEVAYLFKTIRRLKEQGIGIIYISHRMEEVFALSDRVAVLRDGCLVDVLNTSETDANTIVGKMVGRSISDFYPPKSGGVGDVILDVENLTVPGLYENISFKLKKGEILGFSGLVGAGRTEVACGLCGLMKTKSARVRINGEPVSIRKYSDAIKNGLVYLCEDRKQLGLFLRMKIKQNISSTNLKGISGKFFIKGEKETDVAKSYSEKLNIKLSTVEQKVASLSGGNQQKIMVAKWLYTNPKVFILDEPTRGIDVGAKAEIHNMLRGLVSGDTGVIIISSELPEIIGMCDRVIVMRENKVMGEIEGKAITEESIMKLATAV